MALWPCVVVDGLCRPCQRPRACPSHRVLHRAKFQAAQHEVVRLCLLAAVEALEPKTRVMLRMPKLGMGRCLEAITLPEDRAFAEVCPASALNAFERCFGNRLVSVGAD